jgi:hypothetical protein
MGFLGGSVELIEEKTKGKKIKLNKMILNKNILFLPFL